MNTATYRRQFIPCRFTSTTLSRASSDTTIDNLALACLHCNRHKGPNIAGRDVATGDLVRLFHPRQDRWSDHFAWSGAELVERTPIGRITIHVLAINDPDFLAVRQVLSEEQAFPLL